jgi:erythromycin esterase
MDSRSTTRSSSLPRRKSRNEGSDLDPYLQASASRVSGEERMYKDKLTRLLCVWLATVLSLVQVCAAQERPPSSPATAVPADSDAMSAWLSVNAIRLKSVEPGQGFDDLKPLKNILHDVAIVGVGEMTHGSHEFFRFKHRLIEFLVKEMGFTVFALEASYPATLKINDYVLYGKGDRAQALAEQGAWVWDTNEMSELIDWMRAYNQTAPASAKLRFVGFDFQNNEQAMDAVLAYLQRVAPERVAAVESVFKPMRSTTPYQQHIDYNNVSKEERAQILTHLYELIGFLTLHQSRLTRQTSAADFDAALQHARIVAQFADVYAGGQTRDFYMAENIERLVSREKPGTRVIVSAHNDHIGMRKNDMGFQLRSVYGDKYYALGLSFNQGAFQASELTSEGIGPLTEFVVGPAVEGSVEWQLARTGIKTFLVDFRHTTMDAGVARWFADPHQMRSIGLGFYRQGRERLVRLKLKETFDGMAFIETTTRSHPTPTGVRDYWIHPDAGKEKKSPAQ